MSDSTTTPRRSRSSRSTRQPISRGQQPIVGIGLIAWLWLLTAVLAFTLFDRDSPALAILATSLSVFAVSVGALLWRWRLGWLTGLYSLLTLVVLVALYSRPLLDDLPDEARAMIDQTSTGETDRYQFAEALFWAFTPLFTGPTREYLLQPQRIFLQRSSTYYWESQGYVPSHLLAQLYRHMLIESGRFDADEVEYKTGRCFNSPHGYVEIAHPEQELFADPWAAQRFDDYRFGQVVDMPSCDGITEDAEPEGEALN